MKRLWRAISTGGTVWLAAMCIILLASTGFWATNHAVRFFASPTTVVMYSGRKIVLERARIIVYTPPPALGRAGSAPVSRDEMMQLMRDYGKMRELSNRWERFGISVGMYRQPTSPSGFSNLSEIRTFTIRIEYLVALGVLGVGIGLQSRRIASGRLARPTPGRCSGCGYDLRAHAGAVSGVWDDSTRSRQ